MSTRSGKRIHSSLIEEEIKITEVLKPKRKTRNKQKANCDNVEIVIKKKHFVRYPSEDDVDSVDSVPSEDTKVTHKPQRTTLQEINGLASDSDIEKKTIRQTRRTKKVEEEIVSNEITSQEVSKKSKKKKKVSSTDEGSKNDNGKTKNKVSKKKKKKRSSMIEEVNDNVEPLNKSNMSVDSFHSAAGSTLEDLNNLREEKGETSLKQLEPFNECHVDKEISPLKQCEEYKEVDEIIINNTEEKSVNHVEKKIKKKKSKKRSFNMENKDAVEITPSEEPIQAEEIVEINQEKKTKKKPKINKDIVETENIETILNSTFEKETSTSKSSTQNSTFDKITEIPIIVITSSSVEKVNNKNKRKSSLVLLNNSYEMNSSKKQKPNGSIKSLNSTYDKTPETQKKSNQQENALNTTFEKECSKLDTTFEKEKQNPLNSTFEKSNEKVVLDTTFEKESANSKSSLLSSDRSNMTDDKSNSRISISDDSRDNIVNTTPLLIESSMEESYVKHASPEQETVKSQSKVSPHTPLKREGTFTKETNSPIAKSTENTPSKRASVASPGRTPFPFSKSSSKDKSMFNVTRSIEKPRRSSLIDLPRTTKVMFCSPVNNPVIINQMKGKVIKSNLKGSNKSFIFNESARKRSYTQSDADDVSVKRKRLADDLQQSVDRLSRPRTTSASAKLQDATPSKNTPQKSKEKPSRTKLPNFAALHQKQFSKMESLDECQERKAKRAKRMLAVSNSGGRLASPIRKDSKPKKTQSPVKPQLTLESLNPGYTRFGFKMHSDVNPFVNSTINGIKTDISTKTNVNSTKINLNSTKTNINSNRINFNSTKTDLNSTKIDLNSTKPDIFRISTKSDVNPFLNMTNTTLKPKAVKQNELKRQTALPSLAGSTVRKEMAKQTIMREKSFTEKRNDNRKENRTIIKGVRTNRRFELQMKLRNIN
ncbi:uncharacterized protein LOC123699498 isoform X2 [Colias croceus]|uniref:uncharacterized protein LOC123699498 isoform X2 n=1 Tax=Colias crocea TaxID=72248 RepID=UPI001E27FF4E|nr:uncharacterized protein LOC123699498 isoform X2 [Colias croceus]